MSRIQSACLDQILQRIDIVDLIARHVPLKKQGANYAACCPFHKEKTPSFSVSPKKQFYYCFGCGAHGNAIAFLREHVRLGYVQAVQQLAEQAHVTLVYEDGDFNSNHDRDQQKIYLELLDWLHMYYQSQLKQHIPSIDYLQKRQLSGQTVRHFAIGYAPDAFGHLKKIMQLEQQKALLDLGILVQAEDEKKSHYERFRARVMFPIRNIHGQVIGFGGRVLDERKPKYLNSAQSAVFNKSEVLYGVFEAQAGIKRAKKVLVVEGYMDVIMLHQHGIDYAMASLGTACGEGHLQQLHRLTHNIVFAFDGDAAGLQAAQKVSERLLPLLRDDATYQFLFLPAEHDPDSYVQAIGKDAFEQQIKQAMPLSSWLMQQMMGQTGQALNAEQKAQVLQKLKAYTQVMPNLFFKQTFIQAVYDQLGHRQKQGQSQRSQNQNFVPAFAKRYGQKLPKPLAKLDYMIWLLYRHPEYLQNLDIKQQNFVLYVHPIWTDMCHDVQNLEKHIVFTKYLHHVQDVHMMGLSDDFSACAALLKQLALDGAQLKLKQLVQDYSQSKNPETAQAIKTLQEDISGFRVV